MQNTLVVNDSVRSFYNELTTSFENCRAFDLTVAFINFGGLQLLLDSLKHAEKKGVQGRVVTSTYLNFTEPRALRRLKEFDNIDLRIFEPRKNVGFHTKGYIFQSDEKLKVFVGSSNITQSALKQNKEWNVRIDIDEKDHFGQSVIGEFRSIWDESQFADDLIIESYEEIYDRVRSDRNFVKDRDATRDFVANRMQRLALLNLEKIRSVGQRRALAIAATGSGKTLMAALDVKSQQPNRVLFIVHREQILKDARQSFSRLMPERVDEMGLLTGTVKHGEKSIVFSTNLTMEKNLHKYPHDHFDYLIIDEAHHATSDSWRKIIAHFKPKFVLGMTATPERCDGGNIFELFDNNVAVELRLRQALEGDLVVPFHYFGISDEKVDLHDIKLAKAHQVAQRLKVNQRVDFIVEKMNFYGHDGEKRKAIGFCVTQDHAEFMTNEFNERGIKAALITAKQSVDERITLVKRLENDGDDLEVIFTVDVFNEGVDIPAINTILMLRPTTSPVIFIQQLGRGLRKTETKEFLTVIDFIGNHTRTFLIAMALCGSRAYDKDSLKKAVRTDFADIPGCTNIKIDRIAKDQILKQIELTNFNGLGFLKEEYQELKASNHNRVPTLVDFLKFDGSPNAIKFIKKEKSFTDFKAKVEGHDNPYKLMVKNQNFQKLIQQLSSALPIKRPHEFAILEQLLVRPSITIDDAQRAISKYLNDVRPESIQHAFEFMSGKFDDRRESALRFPLAELSADELIRPAEFTELLNSENFTLEILDVIRFGLLKYEETFGRSDYGLPALKLYETYNFRNIALLSNFTKTHSSLRGMGVIPINNDKCLMIDLHKDESIEDRLNYNDKFISRTRFQWQSPNKTRQSSGLGRELINSKELGIKLHLMVRKFKEIDRLVQPYIYIGTCSRSEPPIGEKPITFRFDLDEPVPHSLYEELTGE